MNNYIAEKAAGRCSVSKDANGVYSITQKKFDPNTGVEIDSSFQTIDPDNLNTIISNHEQYILDVIQVKADCDAL